MKKILKSIGKILLGILIGLILALVLLFVLHRIRTAAEKPLLAEPLGQMVEVDGGQMCVYTEGEGDKTLVFLSGYGTPSPILDFKGLYSRLSSDYRIAVVEKFGYGYSDDTDKERSIPTLLEESRQALQAAGIEAPYVLCPHSFSGLQALYWAQTYPEEVEAMVFLDAIVPGIYDICPMDPALETEVKVLSDMGFTRLIPPASISPAIECGCLTEEEEEIYLAFVHGRFRTKAMMNENETVCMEGNDLVAGGEIPACPILFCIADFGITGDPDRLARYRELARTYTDHSKTYIDYDCGHEVHNFEAEDVAKEIKRFLSGDGGEPPLASLPTCEDGSPTK